MKSLKICLSVSFLLFAQAAMADTTQLPGGIGAVIFKYISADVPDSFGKSGDSKDFSIKETLGASIIKGISSDVSAVYDQLHALAPAIANNINLGYVDLEPKIHVTANVYGLAFGISDRVMLAVGAPVMHGEIHVNGGYVNSGSIGAAAQQLKKVTDPNSKDLAFAMGQALEQLPTSRGEYLQNVIVNTYHYKPIGDWSATGIGDMQSYLQIKLYDGEDYRQSLKVGADIPTGKPSDPDNLVDIPFGQGYFDSYLESLHDFSLLGDNDLVMSLVGRYQYSFATTQTFRLSPSTSFPLTDQEEAIHYKPGNAWSTGIGLSTKFFKNFTAGISYLYKSKASDSIRGNRSSYDYSILEDATNSNASTVGAEIYFNTIQLFKKKIFPIPLRVGVEANRVVAGLNTQQVNQISLNVQTYF